MGRPRRTFSAQQKTHIALEALRERHTLSELAQKYDPCRRAVHPTQITAWKNRHLIAFRLSSSSLKKFKERSEAVFDQQMNYRRERKETFQYQNMMSNGTT